MSLHHMNVFLIRHASPAIAEGTFLGHTDPGLSPRGVEQCQALGQHLAAYNGLPTDAALPTWVSDLQRAQETAQHLAQSVPLESTSVPALREINFGEWDGLRYEQIEAIAPGEARMWIDDPIDRRPPQGETLREVSQRVEQWLYQVPNPEQPLAVVAHFGSLCCLAALLLEMPVERAHRLRLGRGQFGHIQGGSLRAWGLPHDHGVFF